MRSEVIGLEIFSITVQPGNNRTFIFPRFQPPARSGCLKFLDDNSPLWDAFGLNAPGASAVPDAPEGLVITPGIGHELYADWADSRRATRYRVWKQVVGVDANFIAFATVTDSDATLAGLPVGKTVKIRITAANDAGESVPSAEVQLVVA